MPPIKYIRAMGPASVHRSGLLMGCLLILGMAACAKGPERWENPALSSDNWQGDTAVCKRYASDKARQEERQANSYGTGSSGTGLQTDTFQMQMGRVSQLRRERDLFESCMESQGYRRAAPPAGN